MGRFAKMHEPLWYLTKDGDVSCFALFRRHYSCRNRKPKQRQFVGPGAPTKKKALSARFSATKAQLCRQSLSDKQMQSLITAGLVKGITPSLIRKLSGVAIRDFAFLPLDGSDVD